MRHGIRFVPNVRGASAALSVLLLLVLCCSSRAQVQWEVDGTLDGLSGLWTGTVTSDGGTHPCEKRYAWILNNSYLFGTLTRQSGSGASAAVPFEEREYLKPSGEHRYSVNRFDNEGISSWGTIDVEGKTWTIALKNSDGGSETAVLMWVDASTITIEGARTDPAGKPRTSYRYMLRKQPDGR